MVSEQAVDVERAAAGAVTAADADADADALNKPTYEITGVVAHGRLRPLLPHDWIDVTTAGKGKSSSSRATAGKSTTATTTTKTTTKLGDSTNNNNSKNNAGQKDNKDTSTTSAPSVVPDFLWENTPRQHTKDVRDHVNVYSHLPNGQSILDSKWVLGRLFDNENNTIFKTGDSTNRSRKNQQTHGGNDPLIGTCETHCFCGLNGFQEFATRMDLIVDDSRSSGDDGKEQQQQKKQDQSNEHDPLPDILDKKSGPIIAPESENMMATTPNLWVVKDAAANGAGGIWVVGSSNADRFCQQETSPLYPEHKYVAQKYVWPPVLYGGKKFHVRVYATITYDGRAYVHHRAFLHVANEPFNIGDGRRGDGDGEGLGVDDNGSECYSDTVHITNCCANSHDDGKFAGEILADFENTEVTTRQEEEEHTTNDDQHQPGARIVVPLAEFFPSVKATVAEVAKRAFPFLEGGRRNNGFEYCGMDFMLSYKDVSISTDRSSNLDDKNAVPTRRIPVAYLLEINAPPSQDTATGLMHAENLHNEVLRDWMNYWVVPRVIHKNDGSYDTINATVGGWRCVHNPTTASSSEAASRDIDSDPILPSKAAILNKIRYTLFERKLAKMRLANAGSETESKASSNEEAKQQHGTRQSRMYACNMMAKKVSDFARTQFPFFTFSTLQSLRPQRVLTATRTANDMIFFENAGGAQVPQIVIDSMASSLSFRHRSVVGSKTKDAARRTAKILFGATQSSVVLGANATSLFSALAQFYLQFNLLSSDDEVVLSTENHKANFDPWIDAATKAGAKIKFWTPNGDHTSSSIEGDDICSASTPTHLHDIITPRTRIVAIPHVSNILGLINPISEWTETIKSKSAGRAHIVVDGVAAVPHVFAAFDDLNIDWYVASMHKMFGPHLGIMLASKGRAMDQMVAASGSSHGDDDSCLSSLVESGTSNLEGCAGVVGLASYFFRLAEFEKNSSGEEESSSVNVRYMTSAGEENCSSTFDRCSSILSTKPITLDAVKAAYRMIRSAEIPLVHALLCGLSKSTNVRILGCGPKNSYEVNMRVPTVSFVHSTIPSRQIVSFCEDRDIMCRHGCFLCTDRLAEELDIVQHDSSNRNRNNDDGVVRFSLAHYNTVTEVEQVLSVLQTMPGW